MADLGREVVDAVPLEEHTARVTALHRGDLEGTVDAQRLDLHALMLPTTDRGTSVHQCHSAHSIFSTRAPRSNYRNNKPCTDEESMDGSRYIRPASPWPI